MIHKNDRVSIGLQIIHHSGETLKIIRVKSNGWLIKNVEHTGRTVSYCPCQLYALPLAGRKRRSRPVQRKIPQSQVHEPLGNIHKGFAYIFRHGTHLFRKRGRNSLYPGDQLRKGHGRCLIQPDSSKTGTPGRFRQPGSPAVRAHILFQIFFKPPHSLFILYLGKGIFHGIHCAVIIEIHLRRFQCIWIHIVDMVLLQLPVVDDFLFFRCQVAKGHVCPDAHGAHDILHERPHQSSPDNYSSLIDGL